MKWRASVITEFVEEAVEHIPGTVYMTLYPDPYPGHLYERAGIDLEAVEEYVDEFVVPLYDTAYGTTYWLETIAKGFESALETPFNIELYAVNVDVDNLIHATEVAEEYADGVFFYEASNGRAALVADAGRRTRGRNPRRTGRWIGVLTAVGVHCRSQATITSRSVRNSPNSAFSNRFDGIGHILHVFSLLAFARLRVVASCSGRNRRSPLFASRSRSVVTEDHSGDRGSSGDYYATEPLPAVDGHTADGGIDDGPEPAGDGAADRTSAEHGPHDAQCTRVARDRTARDDAVDAAEHARPAVHGVDDAALSAGMEAVMPEMERVMEQGFEAASNPR